MFSDFPMMRFKSPKSCQKSLPERQRALPLQQHTSMKTDTFNALQAEADKIRRWYVQTEIDSKQKEKELASVKQTVESQRKSLIRIQMEYEKVTSQLQEEINGRTVCLKKLDSTRDMCILLKDHVSKLEETLNRCRSASDDLREDGAKKEEAIQKLTYEFDSLTKSMKEVSGKYMSMEKESKEQIDELTQHLNIVKTELADTQNTVEENNETMVRLNVQIESLNQEIEMLTAVKLAMEEKLACSHGAILDLKNELSSLKDVLEEENDKSSKRLRELSEQLENAKTKIADYENKTEENNNVIAKLKDQIELLQSELQTLSSLKLSLEGSLTEYDGVIQSCKRENKSLEESLAQLQKNSEAEIHDLKEVVTSQEQALQETECQLDQTKRDYLEQERKLKESENSYQITVESLECKLQELSIKKNELQSKNVEYEDTIRSNADVQSKMEETLERMKTEISQLTDEKENILANKNEYEEKFLMLSKEREVNEGKIRDLEVGLTDGSQQLKDLHLKLEGLNQDVLDKSNQIKTLQDKLEESGNKLLETTEKLNTIVADKKESEKANKKTLSENKTVYKSELKQLRSEIKQAEKEAKNAQKTMEEEIMKLNQEKETLATQVNQLESKLGDLESALKEEKRRAEEEKNEMQDEQSRAENAMREKYTRDLQLTRMSAKETERALGEESEKVMKLNAEIVEKKGRIKELDYEMKHKLRLKDETISSLRAQIEDLMLAREDQNSLSPSMFQPGRTKRKSQTDIHAEELALSQDAKAKKKLVDIQLFDKMNGRPKEPYDRNDAKMKTRKIIKSSTPKPRGRYVAKRSKENKREKQTIEEKTSGLEWFETDSLYGFFE